MARKALSQLDMAIGNKKAVVQIFDFFADLGLYIRRLAFFWD